MGVIFPLVSFNIQLSSIVVLGHPYDFVTHDDWDEWNMNGISCDLIVNNYWNIMQYYFGVYALVYAWMLAEYSART